MVNVNKFDQMTTFLTTMTKFIGFDAFYQQSTPTFVKFLKVLTVTILCFAEFNFVWYSSIYATHVPVRTATNFLLCAISIPLWFQIGQMFCFKDEYLFILDWCRHLYRPQATKESDFLANTIFKKCHQFTFTMIR